MKLTKALYSFKGGRLQINYDGMTAFSDDYALNLIGVSWVDVKYGLLKSIVKQFDVVVTDSDLLAHDDYLEQIPSSTTIVLYHSGSGISASKLRLKNAKQKLKERGIKHKFFVKETSLKNFLNKKGENK